MKIKKLSECKQLKEGIEVATIADYITDHYRFETIDDKYSCIDSIKDSFKDEKTISKEELEQFIGSHNGKDKVNESKSINEDIETNNKLVIEVKSGISADGFNCTVYDSTGEVVYKTEYSYGYNASYDKAWADEKAPYITDIINDLCTKYSIDKNNIEVVAGRNTFRGTNVSTDDVERFKQKYLNESKATHCVYFNQDGWEQIEFEGTEDECHDYIASIESEQNDEFGDEWPERFIKRLHESMKDYRFEVSCNDGPTKVVKLIWDEKDVEGAKEWAKKYYAQEHTTYADDRYNKWIIEESLDEASYGGAFDIADDQIFTREDIDNLAEEVLNHINETYNYKFDISAAYIDGNELEVGVENDELGEYMTTLKIDMRKVKEPWHLKRVYAFEVASDLINQISTSLNGLGESLTESNTEGAKPIETGAALGMATVLSDLIKDEYEAIDGYNTAIATAEAEGFGDMVKVLTDIQAEENIHIGQLQELMKMVDPNASKIEDGTAEAEELLSNPSVNDDDFDFEGIDESFDVSEDDIADEDVDAAIKAVEEAMKESDKEEIDLTDANFDLEGDDEVIVESTEPWEDIYNSFKDIEVQLNGDGEAITATIDRIYNDNKGNPDFEKAYKKWAANE